MSTISFGGLATGLDTESLIESLIEVERAPVEIYESDVEYLEAQNETFESFDEILSSIYTAANALDTVSDFNSWQVTTSSDSPFIASVSSYAREGTYKVEVVSLAQQQKDISAEGFTSSTSASLNGQISIGDTQIDYADISLAELADVINSADAGISAGIVDDGTDAGLHLVLTADDASTTPDIVASGSITIDSTANGHTQEGSQAHVKVDGMDVYSGSNTISGAIYGVTLDLTNISSDNQTSYVEVDTDTDAIAEKMSSLVESYNEMITYIDDVGAADSSLGGEFRNLERTVQRLMGGSISTSIFNSLASVGLETDSETGELSFDSSTFSDALLSSLSDMQDLLVGTDDAPGIAAQISAYLNDQLSSSSGFSATKITSNDEQIDRLETSIERMESRLEKREETLTNQFNALELLVSELNTESSYIESFFADYNTD